MSSGPKVFNKRKGRGVLNPPGNLQLRIIPS